MDEAVTILVTGGRNYSDRGTVYAVLDRAHAKHGIALLIEGGATGADTLARDWATDRGVPVRTFPADWKTHGKAAGPIRNRQMLTDGKPDWVIAFPGGRGTANMVQQAREAGVRVFVVPEHFQTEESQQRNSNTSHRSKRF